MQDFILDAVQWLVWCVVLIKHWYNNSKWKQNDSSSVDQQSRQKRKAMASLSLKRLTALDSIFILQILQKPNIQNPSHPDLIKFRLRFRVSYSVFAAIVHMFITKQCPNKMQYPNKNGLLFDEVSFNITTFVSDWNRLNGEQMAMLLRYQLLAHLCHLQCPQWPANKARTTVCWVCFSLSLATDCQI